jgi:hypothetical protein
VCPAWAESIGFGVSQSGRVLREFLYDGFSESDLHRKVFDGIWADVGGAGKFNERFRESNREAYS